VQRKSSNSFVVTQTSVYVSRMWIGFVVGSGSDFHFHIALLRVFACNEGKIELCVPSFFGLEYEFHFQDIGFKWSRKEIGFCFSRIQIRHACVKIYCNGKMHTPHLHLRKQTI
jgi:hypothetical protein